VALVGIEALGKPLAPDIAFRMEYISRLTGLKAGEPISVETVATLFTHPQGIIQHVPETARIVAFINKVENAAQSVNAKALAEEILSRQHPQIERVVFGAIKKPGEPFTIVAR
jgi:probable selenium-dependent hydroxylase accessory protein YqeC